MATHPSGSAARLLRLGVAAAIQYAGARTRRQYVQALLLLAALGPGARKALDDELGGRDPDVPKLAADASSLLVPKSLQALIETLSDLAIAVGGWLLTLFSAAWAVFGLLAEALLGTVASALREGERFTFSTHLAEFQRQWEGVRNRIAGAFDAQKGWRMLPARDADTPEAIGVRSSGTVVTFSFCAQQRPYRDSGRRVEYRLAAGGVLESRRQQGALHGEAGMSRWEHFSHAVSYHVKRGGEPARVDFDMLAASNDRVFVKARGRADFYFGVPDHLFAGTGSGDIERVPSIYFKLDPEPDEDNTGLVAQISKGGGGLRDYPPDHPQAERLPFLHAAFGMGAMPAMLVSVERDVLYRLDTRPPRLGSGTIPKTLHDPDDPTTLAVQPGNRYEYRLLPTLPPAEVSIPEFAFDRVLSIGVGNYHFYESWSEDHGGEIQWLRKLGWHNLPLDSAMYATLNGPITDGDGAIDGTCNFYVLARLKRQNGTPRYGILWCDEQTFFTKRWRLLDPRDIEPWRMDPPHDINLSVHAMLRNDRQGGLFGGQYAFDEQAFLDSDPFEQGWVDDSSRMAVSRQVVAVSGSRGGRPQLFSINYSYGSVDRRWRTRALPGEAKGAAPANAADLKLLLESLQIREDMTVSIAGRSGVAPGAVAGRWFQRYLPCHRRHPVERFDHAWRFLPQAAWDRVAQFSHLGVLADVAGRTQYYGVDLLAADGSPLDAELHVALDGALVEDRNDSLFIRARKFKWGLFARPGEVERYLESDLPQAIREDREIESLLDTFFFDWSKPPQVGEYRRSRTSMFHEHARFRLLHRGSLGWILVWDDKRDDDLIAISELPRRAALSVVLEAPRVSPGAMAAIDPGAAVPGHGVAVRELSRRPGLIEVGIARHVRVTMPPCVEAVFFHPLDAAAGWVELSIETPLPALDARANLWKCHVACYPAGALEPLVLSGKGLLIDDCRHEAIAGGTRFTWSTPIFAPTGRRDIFTEGGAATQALCVWFENAIGQVSTPDRWVFD